MKTVLFAAASILLSSAGAAGAQGYNPVPQAHCQEQPHYDGAPCHCEQPAVFYGPSAPWGDIRVVGRGVHVYGQPVLIPTGNVYIAAPPVYVDAPPVRIAAPQIYVQSPQVFVRPSNVTVEPPQVHFAGCAEGQTCVPGN